MERRKLGRTRLDVGVIGLGTEHLARSTETMQQVLSTTVDAGVNYVDLLYCGPEFWDIFGPVVRTYRDELILAVHWGDPERYSDLDYCQHWFDDNLERLGNGYADIAILMLVDTETKWDGWAQDSVERLLGQKERGRIGYIGLSSHSGSVALKAVKSGVIDVLMYPVNPVLDAPSAEKNALCQACLDLDVGFVAMKPYGGGSLFLPKGTVPPPTPVQCLHYVLSQPVSTTVPGVRDVDELLAALHYWEATEEEKDYHSFLSHVHRYLSGECTYCNHCLPCPQEINIGRVNFLADRGPFKPRAEVFAEYAGLSVKASMCIECGVCVERCPFGVDVVEKMRKAVEFFEASIG